MLDYMWAVPLLLAPIFILIFLAVLVVALVNASSGRNDSDKTLSGETNLAEMMGEKRDIPADAGSTTETDENGTYARWSITSRHIRTILLLNIIASVVVIAATVVNIVATLTNSPSDYWLVQQGQVAAFQAIPALLVGWLMWLAWQMRKAEGTPEVNSRFARLDRVQRVIGIASIIWFFCMALGSGITGGFENAFLAAAAFTPTLTGMVAMSVTWYVKEKIEQSATEEGANADGE